MSYAVHRQAEEDIAAAFRYYRANAGDKLALRFLDGFERVAKLLEANPGFGTPTGGERRVYPCASILTR